MGSIVGVKTIHKRFIKRTLLTLILAHFSIIGFDATYYVSNSGNNSNAGSKESLAWKTLEKINGSTFKADDQILFKRGDSWVGTIKVNASGTPRSPVVYGTELKEEVINKTNIQKIVNVTNGEETDLTLSTSKNRAYTVVVNELDTDDIATMQYQNVNILRCMLYRTWTLNDRQNLTIYQSWLDGELDKLDKIITAVNGTGIKVIIDLHTLPGETYPNGSNRLFYEQTYADKFVEVWKQIATRYAGNSNVCAFELFNEPVEADPDLTVLYSPEEIQIIAAKAVRLIDTSTPIIFSSNLWNAPTPFFTSPITEINNIIYSVHFYQDMKYSHQGIVGFNQEKISYPGYIGKWMFDKERMRASLQTVRNFQITNNVKIFVGEFSVVRWSLGGSLWLNDAISIFEEYGWDWTYHAWCNYHNNKYVTTLWSLEAEDGSWGDYNTTLSTEPTERKKVILSALSKNVDN